MTLRLGVHPDARYRDLAEAVEYYDAIDRSLGDRLIDEFEHGLLLIEEFPLIGRILFDDYRRRFRLRSGTAVPRSDPAPQIPLGGQA